MSKTNSAYETLRQAILECRLPPDEWLVVSSLKARFGFGWTPLREALSRLEAEHLVFSETNRGYRVAPVSIKALKDLQVARQVMETELLKQSLAEGDKMWEAQLVATHHLLATVSPATASGMARLPVEWEQYHTSFHTALLSGAQSPWLKHLAAQTADQLQRHHKYMLHGEDVAKRLASPEGKHISDTLFRTLGIWHHSQLLEAALARDVPAASTLLQEHIGFSLDVYAALWPNEK